jgi:HD superfamily phosphohydrolase
MSLKIIDYMVDANSIDIEREDVRFIQSLIAGTPLNESSTMSDGRMWLFDIVANRRNSIDVDKWDYLARDCYCLGIKSSYDHSRLMSYSRVIEDQICFHAKEAYNIYEMFHTRYSLFKQVYSHRVGKAIEFMIGDAFKLADSALGISEAINDPEVYSSTMTDNLLRTIEASRDPDLKAARDIVTRIRKRDLYKMVDELLLAPDDVAAYTDITPNALAEAAKQFSVDPTQEPIPLSSTPMLFPLTASQFRIDLFTCNYAMKDRNPVDNVKFFSKWDDTTSFKLEKEKVSLLIPHTFSERSLRVFVTDSMQLETAQRSFRHLISSRGAVTPGPQHTLSRSTTPVSVGKRERSVSVSDSNETLTLSPPKRPKR